jgi:hypothetical protein
MTEANLKLLGQTIRSFREQAKPKKISQFRLATRMNWEGTAPIVEIESGRRRPRPETINALGDALELSPADIAYLHGLAGYREITQMPSLEQLKRVLQAFEPDIAQRPYPAYIMDYQFRIWMMNSAVAALQPGGQDQLREIMVHGLNGLTMCFDSRIVFDSECAEAEAMEQETIFRFKAYNLYRRHEPFYLAYPECMHDCLLPADYARFVKRWYEIDVRIQDVYPIMPQMIEHTEVGNLIFNVHMVDILHLDRLLFAAYYEPKDDNAGNRERCEAFFARHRPKDKSCIRAWDSDEISTKPPAEPLLAAYG